MLVQVSDNNVDQALKALKKKMQREGIFREMKLRNYYEKPSEKRVREQAEAVRRARKLARKRLQREGLLPGKTLTKPGARPAPAAVRAVLRAPAPVGHRAAAASAAVVVSAARGSAPRRASLLSVLQVGLAPVTGSEAVCDSCQAQRPRPRIQSRIAASAPLPLR